MGAWVNMFHLQRNISLSTIGTGASPFVEQILSNLVSCKCPLLILNAFDFWIFHQLHIKSDEFQTDGYDRANFSETLYPCEDIGYPAFERWWQPALGTLAIVTTWFSVARTPIASRTPH